MTEPRHKPTEVCDCPNPTPGRPFHCAATGEISIIVTVSRYEAATRSYTEAMHKAGEWALRRERLVADLHSLGLSYGAIAERIGLSRARVQQMVEAGRRG